MNHRVRAVLFLLFAVVVSLGAVSPAGAAPPLPGPGADPAPAPAPAPGDGSSTPTAAPGTPAPNDSDGGGGGVLPDVDPGAFVTGAFAAFAEGLAGGVHTLLGGLTVAIFGVPTVGDPRDPLTWTDVDGPFWPAVRKMYLLTSALSLVGLGAITMRTLSAYQGRALQQRLASVALSAGMVLLGWWVIQGAFHLTDTLSLALAPDATELFSTPGNVGKFGLTVVAGAIALVVDAAAVVTAVGVVIGEKFVLLVTAALWPVFWMLRPADGLSDTAAGLGLSTFFGLLGATVLQAGLARMVWWIDWSGLHGVEAIGALVGTLVGVLVTFLGVPGAVGYYFIPEAMTVLGRPAVEVADDFSEEASDRAAERARVAVGGYATSARARGGGETDSASATARSDSTTQTRPHGLRHDRRKSNGTGAQRTRPRPTRSAAGRDGTGADPGSDTGRPEGTATGRSGRDGRGGGSDDG